MPTLPFLRLSLRLPIAYCVTLLLGCQAFAEANPKVPAGSKSSGGLHAAMVTDKGTIEFELYATDSPKAVENFRLLAEHGYYDGTKFHRIVSGFMIQGGDPNGNGTGGVSAWGGTFADDIKPDSELYRRGYRRGVLAMANAGPNTNASQFFIMHRNYPLPPNYVIIGKVTKGIEVVDAIAASPVVMGISGEISTPVSPQIVRTVTISP